MMVVVVCFFVGCVVAVGLNTQTDDDNDNLHEVNHVGWHFLDFRVVERLNVVERTLIVLGDEVDGHSLATETTTTSNSVQKKTTFGEYTSEEDKFRHLPMDVVFAVRRQVVVDDQRHLLHVNATGQQIGGDQDTRRSSTELLHDHITLVLVHVSVNGGHGEVALSHFSGEVVDLATRVTEDDRLCHRHGLVQIAQCANLPLLTVDKHIELLDTIQGQLLLLDQNLDGVAHKALADLQHIGRHCGRQQYDLHFGVQGTKHLLDLVLETTRQHLVSLVQHEHLDLVGAQHLAADHVRDTTGRADDDVRARLQLAHIVTHVGATDARVARGVQEVAQRQHHLLDLGGQLACRRQDQRLAFVDGCVNLLQNCDGESRRLAST